jgi:fructose-bisphosphate aldolase class II
MMLRKPVCITRCKQLNKYDQCHLETAAKVNSPVIIQFSNGGAHHCGKGMQNDKLQAIFWWHFGSIAIHNVAKHYGVPVVRIQIMLQKWLPWISGLIDAVNSILKKTTTFQFSHA